MALYTPFFQQATASIGNALLDNQAKELTRSAYMGDQEALGQLYRIDPQAAQRITVENSQRAQTDLARQKMAKDNEESQRQVILENQELIEDAQRAAANIQDLGQAQAFLAQKLTPIFPDYDPQSFTPEMFEQVKQAYGEEDYNKPFLSDGSPNTAYQEYEAGKTNDPVRTQKIDEVSRQLQEIGLPADQIQAEAANVVDGRIRYEVTEQGNVLKVNEVTGEATEVPISGGIPEEEGPNDQSFSLYGLSSEISGAEPSSKALASRISSMFNIEAFPETVTARQISEGATQGLVRALSINDQYPVREIERIRSDMAKIGPSLFSGGPEIRAQMSGLHTLLSNTLKQAERDAGNPRMPTDIRAGAARAANDISNFLDVMGYVDTDILSSPEVVLKTPVASLEEYVRVTPESELNKLPEDVEIAIYERLMNGRK